MRRPESARPPRSGRARRAALLLIGHGSRIGAANRLLRTLARDLRAVFSGRVVEVGYLEAVSPDIQAGIELCVARGARRIVLVPYFLYLGGHVRRDLPKAAARARRRHPGLLIRIAAHLGHDRRLLAIVADRARKELRAGRWA